MRDAQAAATQSIEDYIEQQRKRVDSHINAQIRKQQGAIDRFNAVPSVRPILTHATKQAFTSSAGGKRLRALLALAWFEALKLQSLERGQYVVSDKSMLTIASAIEVYQTAALVHDDIIDDADMRRGKPAAHKALATHGISGVGMGILLGDLLSSLSVTMLTDTPETMPHSVLERFIQMHRDVEFGQVLDLAAEAIDLNKPKQVIDNALAVSQWKTASYTAIAPLALAGLAAGVDAEHAKAWSARIGLPLGLAFQLADDLLDIEADPAITGKPTGGDIREGKRTVLLADTLLRANDEDRAFIINTYQQPQRTDEQCEAIINIMRNTGAITSSYTRIRVFYHQALNFIKQAALEFGISDEPLDRVIHICEIFIPNIPHK